MKRVLLCIILCIFACSYSFANLTQGHWRWRNNDGTETTASWKASQDATTAIADYKAIRLRMDVSNSNSDPKTMDHRLQYATSPGGPWFNISNISAINAFVFGGDNTYITMGDSTTSQITGGTNTFNPGVVVTQEDSSSDAILSGERREYEWCIKPTPQIQSGTTYYFKAAIGDAPNPLPSLTTTGDKFVAGPPVILLNGGFENNLSNWTTSAVNGSAANFTITQATNQQHTGANALAVNVTAAGPANSVTLQSGAITLTDTGAYMLRFWAIADQRNANLDINIQSAAGNDLCHYQIYDRFDASQNGWQMYQYCFKVAQGPVTLQMHFNTNTTYYLDDIEIINETTNPNMDVQTQYVWQNNFMETYGWLSGDNNNPVLLPDSTVAWIYNDSFMGVNDPHSNVLGSSRIINNLIVTRQGDALKSIYNGTAPNSQALFSPGNGNLFWQSGGVIENNSLKVLLIEIAGGNYAGRSWVGTLSLPDLQVVSLHQLPATIDISPNCIISDGDYNYIYFGQSSGTYEMHTIVARVPVGQFDSQTPWEYFTGGSSWSPDYTQAVSIVQGVAAGNVLKLGDNNYVMSGVPHLSSEIDAWFAPTPYGPWGNKTVIYNAPAQEGILAYEGHVDPLPRNGYYTFTYSVYPFVNEPNGSSGSVAMQIADKTTYVPIYARAKLLDLSPYTSLKSADSLVSFTGKIMNQKVDLNWASAQTTDDHYELQRSTDANNWTTIATVLGADSTISANYAYTDNSPATGVNYYRLAIYSQDSKLTVSKVLRLNTLQSATVTAFTALRQTSNIELNWSTSSELDNSGFTVEKSTDGTNFLTLTTTQGAGTSTTPLNYKAEDPSPANGLNYYRLSYLLNGINTYTDIVQVRFPAASILQFTGITAGHDVQLNWTISNTNIDHFVIQHSTNGVDYVNASTVPPNDPLSNLQYQTLDNGDPATVKYYRIQMFDLDGIISYSGAITVNSALSIVLRSFIAVTNGQDKVRLNWVTASEQDNAQFTIERSADNITYVPIATIGGAGTTTNASHYQYVDASPLLGLSYYRLSYMSGSEQVRSYVRTVDRGQKIDLHVYPNPTSAAVQFTLKGYSGTNFKATLSDVVGRVRYNQTFKVDPSGRYILGNKPASGMYLLKLTGEGLNKSMNVVVQ